MKKPNKLAALMEEGAKLYAAGQSAAAAKVYAKALAIAPKDPTVRLRHAMAIWHGENRAEEALATVQALERKYPQAAVHATAGLILNSLGRFAEGAAASRRAVTADPTHSTAWIDLATAIDPANADQLVTDLQALMDAAEHPVKMRRDLHFALALALRKRGRFDEAFDHSAKGNSLSENRWNGDREKAFQDVLRAIFTPELIAGLQNAGIDDQRMIFILGMPRSGTTLLEQMLSSHPDVASAGETPFVGNLFQQMHAQSGNSVNTTRQALARELPAVGRALLSWMEQRLGDAGPSRIIDKMPANYLFIPFIALMLPNARILHMQRHPLDTCLSCYQTNFSYGLDYASDLATLGAAYRQYADLMGDWQSVLGTRIQPVIYEKLVSEPEQQIRSVLEHCGLEWNVRCLDPNAAGTIKTASVAQAREPVNTGSIGRWRPFEAKLAPLIKAMGGMDWIDAYWFGYSR